MATDLVINATPFEVRIALVEYGNLVEFYIERPKEKGLVGNIYKGKVVRVLPGMRAAFVDLGLARTGFLYVDEIHAGFDYLEQRVHNCDDRGCCGKVYADSLDTANSEAVHPSIGDLVSEGQEILVQICKEPIGTKGSRLTSHITLPCRNLVFMPLTDHIGISRKINGEDLRLSLRKKIEALRPAGAGFIVRTVAESASIEELEADMEFLLHLWSDIKDKAEQSKPGTLVYEDLDINFRVVRDMFSRDVDRIVVDDTETYNRILGFVQTFVPHFVSKIHYYEGSAPIFHAYGVESDINRALIKKIWLRCGGYIIIEPTEALTAIDVNTGRYVGKNDLEETIFKTNMEAVKEIAYQLRLRNIGGIIIVDFIDMEDEGHREELMHGLNEAVKNDKSKIHILQVSEFGLVQMTRKRSRDDLVRKMCEPCPYCNGEGMLKSGRTVCYEIFRKISLESKSVAAPSVIIRVHPIVADIMLKEESEIIDYLEQKTGKRVTISADREIHMKHYEIVWEE
ncbi:MAG: Rne/Rng family ribonuclease [Thermodesulfobacteriota bacterium]